jgi:hypothetical protein
MSRDFPILVFVAGPQAGQRAVLARATAVLGRGGAADVMLSEDFVSRRHARYELLQAGPTLENLSDRGTWINGKRYKAGKKLLLETGDLIGMGAETEILFVAAGDDPDAALAVYENDQKRGSAFGRRRKTPASPPPEPAPPEPVEEEPPPQEPEEEPQFARAPGGDRPSETSAGERAEAEAKAKRKKTLIALSAYLGISAIVLVLLHLTKGEPPASNEMPPTLSLRAVRADLAKPLPADPNLYLSQTRLAEALSLYERIGMDVFALYPCVKAFKESLAHGGKDYFDDPEHQERYDSVLDRLTAQVEERYQRACAMEVKRDWRNAQIEFDKILAVVPDPESAVFRNVQEHLRRVKAIRMAEEEKNRPRGPFGT